ncbi:adenine methyltransferase [Desulfuribacillus stibiiarsenatis]|uniref:Adenine methyltransferase n=1 Tax=Desulfuribacillus stibiiarsenatis TaxID=1390249 RepID=A0A1E5L7V2_9FIRM|nr:site-specific DNA-methyltransferase [Desulfuribacillus stibiiarsenatis]OEH86023.1 adenine methyltransferase [Desulfuribacillus stibiiarsenatis]
MNNYKIYNIDCVHGSKEQIPEESVDLIIADPPFNLAFGGTTQTKTGKPRFSITQNDNLEFKEYMRFTLKWLNEAYRILKKRRHIYVFIDWRMYAYLSLWMKRAGFIIKNLIVWDKQHIGLGHHYRFQHEFLIFAVKSKDKNRRTKCRSTSDIWRIPKISNHKLTHPYEKPVELMDKIIINSTEESELVVDFFAGCGTVLSACINNNRDCIAFEIDSYFYDLMKRKFPELE